MVVYNICHGSLVLSLNKIKREYQEIEIVLYSIGPTTTWLSPDHEGENKEISNLFQGILEYLPGFRIVKVQI